MDVGKPPAFREEWGIRVDRYGDQAPRSAVMVPWSKLMMTELPPLLSNMGRSVFPVLLSDMGMGLQAWPPC